LAVILHKHVHISLLYSSQVLFMDSRSIQTKTVVQLVSAIICALMIVGFLISLFEASMWVEETIKEPDKILEPMARGHIENLSKKVDVDEARLPFRLAYLSLSSVSHPFVNEV